MKFGPICPIPHLKDFATGDFHLILSHLAAQYPEYAQHYKGLKDSYIVLDNSAYEYGSSVDANELIEQGLSLGVQEIVIPDVLYDSAGTLLLTEEALQICRARETDLLKAGIRLMLVPQATTIYGWGQNFRDLMLLVQKHEITIPITIGVPKHTERWLYGRANLISRFLSNHHFPVHLLGLGNDLVGLSALSHRFPWIRSTDSVKPFVYAMYGITLSSAYSQTPKYPGRPDDFFTHEMSGYELHIAQTNVDVLNARCVSNQLIESV